MPECAFCPNVANSREHIFSQWMSAVLPGEKVIRKLGNDGGILEARIAPNIDIKARVVCAACNSWLGDAIENGHAKPAMKDLIIGKQEILIPPERARSIALFAFKTAIVVDHMSRNMPFRFFHPEIRHRFRATLEIPPTVMIWMVHSPTGGAVFTVRHEFKVTNLAHNIDFQVCNFRAGSFGFQVAAARDPIPCSLTPNPTFEELSVPCWPEVPRGFVWPLLPPLTNGQFRQFGMRWQNAKAVWH
jgi:hypothetical protein